MAFWLWFVVFAELLLILFLIWYVGVITLAVKGIKSTAFDNLYEDE